MAQTIIVDTTPGYRMPTIYYSQGDIGRTFSIDLQSRFGESLPASPTITIQATKPSGLGFSVGSTSISGAVVTFTVTETMSNEAGRFPAELKIVKNSVTLFTANFYIDCEANAHPEGTTDGDIDHIMPKFMSVTTTTLPAGDSATYSFDANTNTATFGIPKGADGSLASQVLAADYSSSKTYAVGDYVYYSGNLYRCTTAITTAEAWTSGHWTQVALANDVSDVKSDIGSISKVINLIDETKLIDNKYYNESDGAILTGNNTTQLVPLIPVSAGKYYFYTKGITGQQMFSLVIFNSDKTYSRFVSAYDIGIISPLITISGTEAYIGITLFNTQVGNKTALVEEKYKGFFVGLKSTSNVIPPHIAPKHSFDKNLIIVDNKGNGDFTTINDAVASITDDSASNPYTIYIKSGVYKEVVAIQGGRHISLIGENMKDCIIRDDTGLYANCPLQIGGDFLVENLTVIATHDDNSSMPHTGNKAYAIHIDYAGEGIGIVRNCRFISHQSSAIGAGTHQNQTIIIDNCELISYTPNASAWDSESDWTTTPSYGALFVHSATSSNVTNQKLIVKDCMLTSANKRNCAFSNSPDGTSNMEINLINNNMWCEDGNADSTITEWYSPVYSGRSYGNNVAKLNA